MSPRSAAAFTYSPAVATVHDAASAIDSVCGIGSTNRRDVRCSPWQAATHAKKRNSNFHSTEKSSKQVAGSSYMQQREVKLASKQETPTLRVAARATFDFQLPVISVN
ncbi:hypothetical protein FI667_g6034, partial [Globisporangium splendens]